MAQQSSQWGLLIGLQMTITIHYMHSCLMTFTLIAILFRLFNNRINVLLILAPHSNRNDTKRTNERTMNHSTLYHIPIFWLTNMDFILLVLLLLFLCLATLIAFISARAIRFIPLCALFFLSCTG